MSRFRRRRSWWNLAVLTALLVGIDGAAPPCTAEGLAESLAAAAHPGPACCPTALDLDPCCRQPARAGEADGKASAVSGLDAGRRADRIPPPRCGCHAQEPVAPADRADSRVDASRAAWTAPPASAVLAPAIPPDARAWARPTPFAHASAPLYLRVSRLLI